MKNAIISFTLCALIASASARFRSCDRGVLGPDAVGVRIDHCPDPNAICEIIRGRDIDANFDFIATTNAQRLYPEVTAYAFGVRAVYDLPADRQIGCDWISGTMCPLDVGEFVSYKLLMPVVEEYPLTTLDIEVRMYDENNVIQFCYLIESKVVVA